MEIVDIVFIVLTILAAIGVLKFAKNVVKILILLALALALLYYFM